MLHTACRTYKSSTDLHIYDFGLLRYTVRLGGDCTRNMGSMADVVLEVFSAVPCIKASRSPSFEVGVIDKNTSVYYVSESTLASATVVGIVETERPTVVDPIAMGYGRQARRGVSLRDERGDATNLVRLNDEYFVFCLDLADGVSVEFSSVCLEVADAVGGLMPDFTAAIERSPMYVSDPSEVVVNICPCHFRFEGYHIAPGYDIAISERLECWRQSTKSWRDDKREYAEEAVDVHCSKQKLAGMGKDNKPNLPNT